MVHSLTVALLVLASSEAPSAPSFPLGGGIIWWIICARRKQHAIGGWLLFYFWQIFSGAALAAILLVTLAYRGYSPEMFAKHLITGSILCPALPECFCFSFTRERP